MTAVAHELADHLVGNLYYNLDRVPLIAGRLDPETVRYVASSEAAMLYSEMCRLMRDPELSLSAGSLDSGLRAQSFNMAWLAALQGRLEFESLPTLHNYADEIENAALLKRISQYSNEAIQAATEPAARAEVVTADLMAKLATAQERPADTMRSASNVIAHLREQSERTRRGEALPGASTGLATLDRVFRFQNGSLVTIAGRPGQGKTTLAIWMLYQRAKAIRDSGEGGQVVFFSTDDTSEKVLFKMACAVAMLDKNRMEEGPASPDEWQRLDRAYDEVESLPLMIDSMNNPTIEAMYFRCAMLNAQSKVRLAGQDYMGLIKVENARSERQEAEMAANGCKGIARTLEFPWLNLAQITKGVEMRADKWPTPSDLMYSGEAESDVVGLVMRPEHYLARGEHVACAPDDEKEIMLVNVGKNKETGRVGRLRLHFRGDIGRPFDLEHNRKF